MLFMSYNMNIVEYVDLLEDEEYTKMVPLCIKGITWKVFPEKPPWTERGNFSLGTMYSSLKLK